MLNYLKKFSLEILPSVAATVIGAYIVNHYISRPTTATEPPTAAVVAPADTKKNDPQSAAAKPADQSSDVAGIPEPGVKAKGISERAMIEKLASERPAQVKPDAKPAEIKQTEANAADAKPVDAKATDTADQRHHAAPAPHEKAIAKTTPVTTPAVPVENTAATPQGDRDANDLARAAIERLRNADGQHPQEASRAPDAPRAAVTPVIATPAATTASLRPLPPPITVSTPPIETQAAPPYTASVSNNDPNRMVPPADIPPPPPIDLRANANKLVDHTHDVAEHMLSAAKSMFHAVLPKSDPDSPQQSSSNSQFTD
jgi:hypothetical protein